MTEVRDLSIGEVINLLRDDFPDVSVSKIRFLESQGLIDPDRSGSGYRRFDSNDVARLRFILQQQRDHFLPLKVIKSKLTLWERGEDLSRDDGAAPPSLDQGGEPLDRSELLKRSNGADAAGVDAVLMDVMMPGLDGHDTMRIVRQIDGCRDLPIVAVTAKAMVGDREKCIEAGATDYVAKPVDIDELLEKLRRHLPVGD